MTRLRRSSLYCVLTLAMAACGQPPEPSIVETESSIFTMDRIYKSMLGPRDLDRLKLLSTDEPEVLWVTAIKADVVGSDGETPESAEYFCHSAFVRLESQKEERRRLLGRRLGGNRKMFTLVQGQNEIRFPEGFGMPVLSNDEFLSSVMVMNPSEPTEPVRVGVDSRIEYVREAEADGSIRPLYLVPLVVRVPVESQSTDPASHAADHASHAADHASHDTEHASHDADHASHGTGHASHDETGGESCLSHDEEQTVARSVDRSVINRSNPIVERDAGKQETGHWYVPPGRHVYRYKVQNIANSVLFDTRAHYIGAHLHPFGESLELLDLTTGESVFKSVAENLPDRIALDYITHYSSVEGIPIHPDHEYELVAVYNNTTGGDVDSMAVMYMYLEDTNRARPAQSQG